MFIKIYIIIYNTVSVTLTGIKINPTYIFFKLYTSNKLKNTSRGKKNQVIETRQY